MSERSSFDYAIVRVAPHVEREEFINVGVILFCRTRNFLAARVHVDATRLAQFFPELDASLVLANVDLIPRLCAGGAEFGAIGELSKAERFHWLTSPRSTAVQVSPVHCGLCDEPEQALDELFTRFVGRF